MCAAIRVKSTYHNGIANGIRHGLVIRYRYGWSFQHATKEAAMARNTRAALVPVEHITQSILVFRGHKVLLDAELAALYGVSTARLNQQVRRNHERFPEDFMFQLSAAEYAALMLQNATSKPGRGGRRKAPARLHRARGDPGRHRPEQPPRRRNERLRRACLREAATTAGLE